jgi:hypothetical protein
MATTMPTKLIQLRNNEGGLGGADSEFMGTGLFNKLYQARSQLKKTGCRTEP